MCHWTWVVRLNVIIVCVFASEVRVDDFRRKLVVFVASVLKVVVVARGDILVREIEAVRFNVTPERRVNTLTTGTSDRKEGEHLLVRSLLVC